MNKTITIIGPNVSNCTIEMYEFGIEIGKLLIDMGFVIINGGMLGMMEAVFKGARLSDNYAFGKTIGIIPSLNKNDANKYCDIVIPTGLNYSRNQIVINCSEIIIAIGGGAGTLSEIAYAWQLDKKIIAFDNFGGWSEELAGKKLDNRLNTEIKSVSDLKSLENLINLIST